MKTKKCGKCGEDKPLSEYWRDGPYLQSFCKECKRVAGQKYWSEKKAKPRRKVIPEYPEIMELWRLATKSEAAEIAKCYEIDKYIRMRWA